MNRELTIPDILTITGHKNAGKDLVAQILTKLYKENGVEAIIVSTGDLGRERIAEGDVFAKKLEAIHNAGGFYADHFANMLVLNKITRVMGSGKKILQIGGPRRLSQCIELKKWLDDGTLGTIKSLEVIASPEIRLERAVTRTAIDKRMDLSKDTEPGVLDLEKYQRMVAAYGNERDEIVRFLIAADMYLNVTNDGTTEELEIAVKNVLST